MLQPRAADIFLENGVHIETGPHKHAIQQTFFLYVYEPDCNRVDTASRRLQPTEPSRLPRRPAACYRRRRSKPVREFNKPRIKKINLGGYRHETLVSL